MSDVSKGMPKEIAEIYEPLYNEVCSLGFKWRIFCQLYTDKENVGLLNEIAPSFFSINQNVMLNDILLTISRLTDPHQTSKSDNLSFAQLLVRIDENTHKNLKSKLDKIMLKMPLVCDFARKARNKRIAHNDLITMISIKNSILPSVTKTKIDNALKVFHKIMNELENHFQKTTVLYEAAITYDDGAILLKRLKESKIYRAEYRRNRS